MSFKFKVLVFGDGGVGKTTLINRYLTGLFAQGTITIGVDFHIKTVEIEGKKVTLQIWDFAGEDRFRFLLPSYAKGANGVIFMFDITRYTSLNSVNEWLDVFKNSFKEDEVEEVPMIIVGGKLDLNERRTISRSDAENIASEFQFYDYLECSSKTGENVEEIFNKIARFMMEKARFI
ncbi:MAG: GTP-binding protein [Promethearchaeota archaeon]|nr:MAG: GTP-binding protein [Candidatus Lokiarchaeota archaeon]